MDCSGCWKKSKIYLSCKDTSSHRRMGVRVWMTRAQIVQKHGEEAADAIILRKQQDPELSKTDIRPHPDLPDSPELTQYRILDTSQEVETTEDVMQLLYEAVDGSGSSSANSGSGGSSSAKNKKDKGKAKKDKTNKKQKMRRSHRSKTKPSKDWVNQ